MSSNKNNPTWVVWVVLIGILIALLAVLSIPVFMAVGGYYLARDATQSSMQNEDVALGSEIGNPGEQFQFAKDFRVETADQDGPHFIKLRLGLAYSPGNPALAAELEQREVQLRNIVNLILFGKTKDKLSTVKQRLELQEEIKSSVNHILENGKINHVIFLEFTVN